MLEGFGIVVGLGGASSIPRRESEGLVDMFFRWCHIYLHNINGFFFNASQHIAIAGSTDLEEVQAVVYPVFREEGVVKSLGKWVVGDQPIICGTALLVLPSICTSIFHAPPLSYSLYLRSQSTPITHLEDTKMRFLPVSYATILFAIHASAYSPLEDLEEDPHHDWREELGRDATADDYRQHGEPLPVVAPAVTSIRDEQSYIVKVDCLSCSSRVRNLWQLSEHIIWDVVEQETSFVITPPLSPPSICFPGSNRKLALQLYH